MRIGPARVLLGALAGAWILQTVTASSQAERAFEVARGRTAQHLDALVIEHGVPGEIDHRELRLQIDERGKAHRTVQELYRGVPVFGGEAIVHLDVNGDLEAVTDNYLSSIGPLDTRPLLTARDAIDRALDAYGADPSALTAPPLVDLWVFRSSTGDRLTYRVRLRREDGSSRTALPIYFIDAGDGSVVWQYDNLQTGTGESLYSGTVDIDTLVSNGRYYLEDRARKLGTFDFRNTTSIVFRFSDLDDIWNGASQKAAVDAHYAARKFYDYFLNVHGRNGIDGSGGPGYYTSIDGVTRLISSRVHYSSNYNNAFWNGQTMTYGDGDGITFTPLVTLDIAGHEMTHGVTQFTAGLTYSGESGALNESFSDIFGAMVERYARGGAVTSDTWKIGEQAFTPGTPGDALRYLDNPHAAANSGFTADDDPDHYSERYTGTGDNGGVHINSGISNKAFYLLAVGGTHHLGGTVTGIGVDDAERIFYKALTTYMTSSTNFAGARTATLNAAAAIFGAGTPQEGAVREAWCAVGVGSCSEEPPPPSSEELITNGGFEGRTAAPWVLSGTVGYGNTVLGTGSFPHSGEGYVFLGNANSASGQVFQQITIPSNATSANLTFWLNVSSSETTTTTQFDKLFVEVRNTSGTLLSTLATYSNLSKAAAGAYSQKGAFSLLSFAGQTVRVQFRATTDFSLPTIFRVDDVSVQ